MARYTMIALSYPVQGREAEFNTWYQDTHLPEVVAFPGVTCGQRYRLTLNFTPPEAAPYLAVYDIETNDLNAMLQAMKARGGMASPALDVGKSTLMIYEEFGAPVHYKP